MLWKAILGLLLALVLVVGGYVAYVMLDYYRVEDNQELLCVQRSDGALEAENELTLITWNLGFGAYNDNYSFFMDGGTESRAFSEEICERNIQTVIEALKAQDADIMLLQEIDVDGTRSYHVDQLAMLEAAFADSHSSVFAQNYDSGYLFYPFSEPIGANRGGILSLAKAKIDGAVRISLPIESGFRKFFDLDRCYSVSRIPVSNGKTLALFNLHLSAYTTDGTIATEQLRKMLAHMQREYDAGNYVVAGGDFNKDVWGDSTVYTGISGEEYTWAQPFPTELLPQSLTLVDSRNGEKPVLSCRDTSVPYEKGTSYEVTLDAFIVSDNIEIVRCEVLDEGFKVSDHNPVKLCLRLKA